MRTCWGAGDSPSTALAVRACLAAWGGQEEPSDLGAVLGRDSHHLPEHLTLPAPSPPQPRKDSIYFYR